MSDAVLITVISTVGLVMSGVLVELIRARKRQETVVHEVKPNSGGSFRDMVTRLAEEQKLRHEQVTAALSDMDRRLVKVETYAELFVPRQREGARGE